MKFDKKIKAVTGMFLASAMIAGLLITVNNNTSAKADSVDATYKEVLPAMEIVAKGYAEMFAEEVNDGINLKVDEATPIYDIYDNVVGYSVALKKGFTDYGYVNIDYSSEGLVTDFNVDKKADSMYDILTSNFEESERGVKANECEEKLISVDGFNYAVEKEGTYTDSYYYAGETYNDAEFEEVLNHYEENYLVYYDNIEYEDDFVESKTSEEVTCGGGNEIQKGIIIKFKDWVRDINPDWYNKLWADDEFVAPTKYPDHGEVFKTSTICELDTKVMLSQYSKEMSLISQENIMKTTNRYACELVGITAICQQEGLRLNDSLKDTFNKLWDLAGCEERIYKTDTFYEDYIVDCSSTYTHQWDKVLNEYAALFGKKVDTDYERGVKFEFFKESIDKGNSTSFGYQIANEGGHGVNVVGYAEGQVAGRDIEYIITGDSWYDDAPRYVLYGRGMFESTEANSFNFH